MATRSRLGRDPLSGVAQPGDKKTARPAPKKTSARTAPVKTKAAAVPPIEAPVEARPAGPNDTEPRPEATAVPVRPIPESVLVPDRAGDVNAVVPSAASSARDVPPIPQSGPTPDVGTPAETRAPEPARPASRIEPIPQSVSLPDTPDATAMPALGEGPHPAEVFLRGVLEGLTPAGALTIDVEVDPETFGLPVEKLFYFSHVLQLLVSPLECPTDAWRRPGDGRVPVATVSVRLRKIANDRHSLRIYDNGLFFRQYLSDVSLEQEALRPLVLFVVKRHGSLCLKQAASVEFEIIG